MHVFPRRCDPLVDVLHAQCTNTIGKRDEVQYINGWKEMLWGENTSFLEYIRPFFYMRRLHGDNYAIIDAIFFLLCKS